MNKTNTAISTKYKPIFLYEAPRCSETPFLVLLILLLIAKLFHYHDKRREEADTMMYSFKIKVSPIVISVRKTTRSSHLDILKNQLMKEGRWDSGGNNQVTSSKRNRMRHR